MESPSSTTQECIVCFGNIGTERPSLQCKCSKSPPVCADCLDKWQHTKCSMVPECPCCRSPMKASVPSDPIHTQITYTFSDTIPMSLIASKDPGYAPRTFTPHTQPQPHQWLGSSDGYQRYALHVVSIVFDYKIIRVCSSNTVSAAPLEFAVRDIYRITVEGLFNRELTFNMHPGGRASCITFDIGCEHARAMFQYYSGVFEKLYANADRNRGVSHQIDRIGG